MSDQDDIRDDAVIEENEYRKKWRATIDFWRDRDNPQASESENKIEIRQTSTFVYRQVKK